MNPPNHQPLFSIHDYDQDGDIVENGIFLHFGDTRVKIGNTIKEFDTLIANLQNTREEIVENYNI